MKNIWWVFGMLTIVALSPFVMGFTLGLGSSFYRPCEDSVFVTGAIPTVELDNFADDSVIVYVGKNFFYNGTHPVDSLDLLKKIALSDLHHIDTIPRYHKDTIFDSLYIVSAAIDTSEIIMNEVVLTYIHLDSCLVVDSTDTSVTYYGCGLSNFGIGYFNDECKNCGQECLSCDYFRFIMPYWLSALQISNNGDYHFALKSYLRRFLDYRTQWGYDSTFYNSLIDSCDLLNQDSTLQSFPTATNTYCDVHDFGCEPCSCN